MALYSRAMCIPQLRSILAVGKIEQVKPLFRNVKVNLFRSFSRQSGGRQPFVVHQSLLYYGLGGLVAGAAFTYLQIQYNEKKDLSAVFNEVETKPIILESLPSFLPSRTISVPTDSSGLKLTLYQYPTCPFCCKVRAFLDYYGISYDVVEVDPVLRQQIKWSNYKKVPILLAQLEDGSYMQLNDSTMIISVLKTYLQDKKHSLVDIARFYPTISFRDDDGSIKSEIQNRYFIMSSSKQEDINKEAVLEEVKWRKWADTSLVHVLSPNVYRTWDEALQSFKWFSSVGEWDRLFPSWEHALIVNVGAFAMWMIGKRLKKRHMLKEDVRESLYDDLNTWTRELSNKGTPFCGGVEPNLADLAVYGVLSSIEGCQAFQDALDRTKIKKWYSSMKTRLDAHAGSNTMTGR